jgi:site-specific DNA-methyltransferase (adenine-specific)
MAFRLIEADCIEAMASMDEASVDAIVTDPPYGLEFMGKEWDRLDAGLPQENVWKGRHGKGGSTEGDPTERWSKDGGRSMPSGRTSYGGKRTPGKRCVKCGKRQFSGTPCNCDEPEWVLEYPAGPPSGMVRMQRWHQAWATEALRVLKPGGHLLAFGGTRTYHRLACALEDAGFEIRDCLAWLYGSGFPKSLDVSKAIDKAAGAERQVVGQRIRLGDTKPYPHNPASQIYGTDNGSETGTRPPATAPATPDAERWQGWGTALKPAFEPIVLARKPLIGSVAQNVLEHGTGALNIDGTRIEGEVPQTVHGVSSRQGEVYGHWRDEPEPSTVNAGGRWPPNVLLDEEAAAMLDEQSGERGGSGRASGPTLAHLGDSGIYGKADGQRFDVPFYGDSGGASRFFYIAKADREERNRGLEHHAEKSVHPPSGDGRVWDIPGSKSMHRANNHPTVKPVELMQWLCRLITPPKGTILDPFTGSGSTGIAALREGFEFIGIEREPEYVSIARDRILGDAPLFNVEGL